MISIKTYLKETFKYLLRSYPFIKKYVKELDSLNSISSEELRNVYESKLRHILKLAYKHSTFYKKLYDETGVKIEEIQHIEDLSKLPVVTKETIRKHVEDIRTLPKILCVKTHTSGTTGEPLYVYRSWPTIWKEAACTYYYRRLCGFNCGSDVLISIRYSLSSRESSMWLPISRTLFISAYNINHNSVEKFYCQIKCKSPKAIEGFPSVLYRFACEMETHNLTLHIPLCFTASENVLDYQRNKIESVFHTKIFDNLGNTEMSIKLYERLDHNGYYEQPGYSINEYYNDNTISTGLINESFPLIRYAGSDIVTMENGDIKGINGRSTSFIEATDGTKFFTASLVLVIPADIGIVQAQFVQREIGLADLNIITKDNKDLPWPDYDKLQKSIANIINNNILKVSIRVVDHSEIIYSSRGKFNFIVNRNE